jgi:hypothetical protein
VSQRYPARPSYSPGKESFRKLLILRLVKLGEVEKREIEPSRVEKSVVV